MVFSNVLENICIFATMRKKTKIQFLVIIICCAITLLGCTNSSTEKQLANVDSLLAVDKLNDAEKELYQLRGISMNESERAKYNFLSILTVWRLFQPIKKEIDLDKSISYYEHQDKDGLLARCFFLKGELLADKGKIKEAILFYKKAEQRVAKSDLMTQHHIYESLSLNNMRNEAMGIAIVYALKALPLAQQLHKPDWEGYEYYLLTLSYNSLGKTKEAQLYMQRLLQLLPRMSEKGQMDVLEVLGQHYQLQDPKLMEQFMHKALSVKSNITPYLYMAARRYNQGRKEEAYQFLNIADKQCNGKHCYALIELRRDMKLHDKDYKSANLLSMQLVQLEDSILKADNRKNVEAVQNNFEQQLREQKQQRIYAYILTAVLALILSIGLLIIYLRLRVHKMKSMLSDDQLEISILNKQIGEVEKNLADTDTLRLKQKNEINKLKQEIAKVEEHHNGFLADGRQCYENILKGKTIITWEKYHFHAFIEYYKLVDAEYLYELDKEFQHLTDRNKLIYILLHLGLSQTKIAERLGVSEGAIRTALSRNQKKRNKE